MNIIFKAPLLTLLVVSVEIAACSTSHDLRSYSPKKSLSCIQVSWSYPGETTRKFNKPLLNLPGASEYANEQAVATRIALLLGKANLPTVTLTDRFITIAKTACVSWGSRNDNEDVCLVETINTIDEITSLDLCN